MKNLIFIVMLFYCFGTNAMINTIDCTAYGTYDLLTKIDKLEIKSDQTTGALGLYVNGQISSLIKSSDSCGEDLECNFMQKQMISFIHPQTNIGYTTTFNYGQIKLEQQDDMRGGIYIQKVTEITFIIRGGTKTQYLYGTCYQNF